MTGSRKMAVIGLIKAHIARLSADGELLNEISYFCEQLEKASLKQRVEDALSFRKQGHFDKAMLGISEVNRDQVTALRKIQALLGKVDDKSYPVPVFEKFRQQEPFEIGLSDAAPTLQLLDELNIEKPPEMGDAVSLFHELEAKISDESGYIEFLQKKGAEASELEKTEADRNVLLLEADEVRASILGTILRIVDLRTENLKPSRDNSMLFLELVQCVYQVITSSIATKHSIDVDAF